MILDADWYKDKSLFRNVLEQLALAASRLGLERARELLQVIVNQRIGNPHRRVGQSNKKKLTLADVKALNDKLKQEQRQTKILEDVKEHGDVSANILVI